jgi:Spy/CpxP family protein refolding chaperone
MKTLTKSTLAIIAALSLASIAVAEPQPGQEGYGPGGPHPMWGNPQQRMEKMQQRHTERLQKLQQQLNLKPEQQAAWQAFVDAQNAMFQSPRGGWRQAMQASTTTPDRFNKMVELMEKHVADMKEVASKAKALYDVLDPQQKSTMDQFYAKGPGFGRGFGKGFGEGN